jgi:adenylylsulfate reductase, subunit B
MGFRVKINQSKCKGCGNCVTVCPKDLIKVKGGTARVAEPNRCDGLAGCVKRCPEDAISITRT